MPQVTSTDMSGPSIGDKVRLADTDLVVTVEKDFTRPGTTVDPAGGRGASARIRRSPAGRGEGAVDSVITNVLIIDHWGIVKADVGLRDGRIAGIGRAGDPQHDAGVDILVGSATEVIAGAGRILTAGAIDTHVPFIAPQQATDALCAGVTTMLGGGAGPATGTATTAGTPGPWHLARMIAAADAFAVNLAFTGRGNASRPRALEEQVEAGAAGLVLRADRDTPLDAVESCLAVGDTFDVQVTIHGAVERPAFLTDAFAALSGRTIHACHTDSSPAPDIIAICGMANVLPSSAVAARPYAANTSDEQDAILRLSHRHDDAFATDATGRRSRAAVAAAADILHDIGALSIIASGIPAPGRGENLLIRTFQAAHKMKAQRGTLAGEEGDSDNFRVKRYLAKVTINPAIAHGLDEWVGSVEVGKLADLVLWSPAFFGVKPDLVFKLGTIAAAPLGDPAAFVPAPQPVRYRPMFGAFGRTAAQPSVTFVSQASLALGIADRLDVARTLLPVRNTRSGLSKESMIHNSALPQIEIDRKTGEVRADGELLASTPAAVLPLAQRYFLF